MLKSSVENLLRIAWENLQLPAIDVEVVASERPEYGDFSTNLALVGASATGHSPRELAEMIVAKIPKESLHKVEVAGPGFINVFLLPTTVQGALSEIMKAGDNFGLSDTKNSAQVQIEFVSSNPTGPLTIGHGRQAVLGDVLSSIYSSLGHSVSREYYFNDEGRQIELLSRSLWIRYRQLMGDDLEVPEEGYLGDYLIEIAKEMTQEHRDHFPEFDTDTGKLFRQEAVSRMKNMIQDDLAALGVRFDYWFSEASLHASGEVKAALKSLQEKNGTYEKDGAIWLRAEEHGGAKDSVLIRSDGRPTYLMVDIAYHLNKRQRGYERVIDVQGADHHAEQSCVKAAMRILGLPDGFLDYAVHQFVSVKEGGSVSRMSTRAGRFVLLRDLVQELGPDVVRYFMVARKPESHLEFDIDLARAQSLDNPVYYIQYAHTRICSILRRAETEPAERLEVDLSPLNSPAELALIKLLDRFPNLLEECARSFAPHLLADYALGLAREFHSYYDKTRVIVDDLELKMARLALVAAIKSVFRRSLSLLGMSAPEVM